MLVAHLTHRLSTHGHRRTRIQGKYLIPKGEFLLTAVWRFLHDPSVYPEPESFDPGRFLSLRKEPDLGVEAFEYDRRICPGRFLADSGLYMNIVQLLAVLNVSKAVDEREREIEVNVRQYLDLSQGS